MKIENPLSKFLAYIIINGSISFIKIRFKGLNITDELIYKSYYELTKFMEKTNIDELTSKDQFIEVMVHILKSIEGAFDDKQKEDPEFINNMMKKHAWLWDLYKAFSETVTSENVKKVKDSAISKEIGRQITKTMVKDKHLLDYKVKRDVDYALDDIAQYVEPEIPEPIFSSDELRITAPWANKNNPE